MIEPEPIYYLLHALNAGHQVYLVLLGMIFDWPVCLIIIAFFENLILFSFLRFYWFSFWGHIFRAFLVLFLPIPVSLDDKLGCR